MLLTSIDGAAVVVGLGSVVIVVVVVVVVVVAYATVPCEMPSTLIVCVATLFVSFA